MDEQLWKSGGRFPCTLPTFGVDAETYDKILAYNTQHKLNLAEFMRKATLFFLADEYAKGALEYPTSVPHKAKHKNARVAKEKVGVS